MLDQLPKWAFLFLEWTCSSQYLDELEGDLLELFEREEQAYGFKKARRKFVWRTLLSIRWYRLPKIDEIHPIMLYKNYYKVAVRHAFKHRSESTVHVLGLLFGLATVFYIALFIKSELQFDSMHEKGDQIYRVLQYNSETGERGLPTSTLHGEKLAESYPYINVCRFGNDPVKIGNENPILVEDFHWSDSSFFDFFSFDFVEGDPSTCLNRINSLVITSSLKEQLFGSAAALGQSINVKVYDGDQEFPMTITGVVADPPAQTHLQFKALGPMANAEKLYGRLLRQWGFSWLRTYIEVPNGRIARLFADGIPRLYKNSVWR